jgi:alkylation response protein AidB-like acyl-CoA dehydrogenase
MDFSEDDRLAEYRQDARDWVAEYVDPQWAEQQRVSGSYHTPELHSLVAGQGWLGAGWPAEYGGTANDPDMAAALFEEIDAAGLHMDGWATTKMISQTLLHAATEEQKREFIGGALRGEIVIVLGYTEPDSGSDVAAAKTRSERDGEEWLINGQKMFTSTAHRGTHVFMLTRSNTEVPKHKGLTTFLVPLGSPGVEIRPIYTLGGQRTNATFYSDVRVPDSARIGPVDGGWGVMHVALVFERSGTGGGRRSGPTLSERVATWAQPGCPAPRARPRSCSAPRARSVSTGTCWTSSAPRRCSAGRRATRRWLPRSRRRSVAEWSALSTAAPRRSCGRSSPSACSACPVPVRRADQP